MDIKDKQAITTNLVFLNKNTVNIEMIVDHLISTGTISMLSREDILRPDKTNYQKVCELYHYIQKKGPNAFSRLLDALDSTGNGFVADRLRTGKSSSLETHTDIFKDLCQTIGALRSSSKFDERLVTGPLYRVGVGIFQGMMPKSGVGLTELPYLMAIQGGIPKPEVMKWPDCPPIFVLSKAFEIYHDEVKSARRILLTIKSGGLFIKSSDVSFEKCFKVLCKLNGSPLGMELEIKSLILHHLSEHDINVISILLHFILTYGGPSIRFVVRKDFESIPSAYLLYNSNMFKSLIQSPVILSSHIDTIKKIISLDETHTVPHATIDYKCPF